MRFARPLLLLALLGLLAFLQYHFWFGRGSSGEVVALEKQVDGQKRANDGLRDRNAELAAEVEDLKSGEAAAEERARNELGMIKPGEKFYRVVEPVPPVQSTGEDGSDGDAAEPAP